jgi:hypothetical protein
MIFWRRTRGPESRVLDPGSRRPVAGSGADLLVSNHLAKSLSRADRSAPMPIAGQGQLPFQFFAIPVVHFSGSADGSGGTAKTFA